MARLHEWFPWCLPGIYLLGALLASTTRRRGWLWVTLCTRGALFAALLTIAAALETRQMAAASLVAALIAFLGWIIGDYSSRYLRGEAGQTRFIVAFLATLAAVSTVVLSTNLVVIVGAWSASSLALHHLLTFYRERPAAIIVAHKKFLASRLAEVCLIAATVLLYREPGSLDLSALAAIPHPLPPPAAAAAVLIAAAVLLKSAQLPLHGWLIQVMEAPTPVSALLHAGVVNLGGYVLIRLAPLIEASMAAQTLLVIVGSLTAALAGLVMLTRITIKVRLAWSTCSQMGFMVMECGLGLFDLALLHLLAHSVYKAHAFLTAGEAVREAQRRELIEPSMEAATGSSRLARVLALPAAALITTGSAMLWHRLFGIPAIPWIAPALLACGLSTLLWSPSVGGRLKWSALAAVAVGAQIYLGWHWLLAGGTDVVSMQPSPVLSAWTITVFLGLYAGQCLVPLRRRSVPSSRLYDWVHAGFYLDERFTRATFRIWPVPAAMRTPNRPADPQPIRTRSLA